MVGNRIIDNVIYNITTKINNVCPVYTMYSHGACGFVYKPRPLTFPSMQRGIWNCDLAY